MELIPSPATPVAGPALLAPEEFVPAVTETLLFDTVPLRVLLVTAS